MKVFVAKNITNAPFVVTMGTTHEITLHNLQRIIGFPILGTPNEDYRGS